MSTASLLLVLLDSTYQPLPPPGSFLMISEITEGYMVTESGDYMITE